jgi:uncharacterized damage-inducible protein DinB
VSDPLQELLESLVAHNEWADNKILDAVAPLSDDDIGRKHDPDGMSIRRNMIHAVGTQLWWISNWSGVPMKEYPRERAALRIAHDDAHAGLRTFVRDKTPADWARTIDWRFPGSDAVSTLPLCQTLLQVVSHSLQHRAETAMLLTALGRSPGNLDYIGFQLDLG